MKIKQTRYSKIDLRGLNLPCPFLKESNMDIVGCIKPNVLFQPDINQYICECTTDYPSTQTTMKRINGGYDDY